MAYITMKLDEWSLTSPVAIRYYSLLLLLLFPLVVLLLLALFPLLIDGTFMEVDDPFVDNLLLVCTIWFPVPTAAAAAAETADVVDGETEDVICCCCCCDEIRELW